MMKKGLGNEYVDELNVLIPSEYVRNYVLETGWGFTDKQKAVLLVHGDLSLKEQCSRLRALQESTADQSLKERIAKYLNSEDLRFQAFKVNSDKAYIYILKVKEGDIPYPGILPDEYFFDFDLAYGCGRETSLPFMIEKYPVEVPGIGSPRSLFTTFLEFNEDGESVYFYGAIQGDDGEPEDFNDFIEVPNPFEKGDIVRIVGTERYGIIATSPKWWRSDMFKYKNGEPCWKDWDFYDAQIRVEFLCEDGTFSHDHVNPLRLERYQPEEGCDKRSAMDKLLLQASHICRGEGSLEMLYLSTMAYRRSKE